MNEFYLYSEASFKTEMCSHLPTPCPPLCIHIFPWHDHTNLAYRIYFSICLVPPLWTASPVRARIFVRSVPRWTASLENRAWHLEMLIHTYSSWHGGHSRINAQEVLRHHYYYYTIISNSATNISSTVNRRKMQVFSLSHTALQSLAPVCLATQCDKDRNLHLLTW